MRIWFTYGLLPFLHKKEGSGAEMLDGGVGAEMAPKSAKSQNSNPELEPLLTIEDARRILNVGRSTVYQMVSGGSLRHVRLGIGKSAIRFRRADLLEYLEKNTFGGS